RTQREIRLDDETHAAAPGFLVHLPHVVRRQARRTHDHGNARGQPDADVVQHRLGHGEVHQYRGPDPFDDGGQVVASAGAADKLHVVRRGNRLHHGSSHASGGARHHYAMLCHRLAPHFTGPPAVGSAGARPRHAGSARFVRAPGLTISGRVGKQRKAVSLMRGQPPDLAFIVLQPASDVKPEGVYRPPWVSTSSAPASFIRRAASSARSSSASTMHNMRPCFTSSSYCRPRSSGMPRSNRPPPMPPATAPDSVAAMGPAARMGPTPGMARAPTPAIKPPKAPMPLPQAAPSAMLSIPLPPPPPPPSRSS